MGIPFCPTRCAYCSFISASGSANRLIPDYLDALLAEIDAAGAAARRAGKTVRSVYLGGGDPHHPGGPSAGRAAGPAPPGFPAGAGHGVHRGGGPAGHHHPGKIAHRHPGGGGGNRISVNPPDHVRPCPWQPSAAATGPRISAGPMPWPGRPVGGAVNMDLIAGLPADTPAGFRRTVEEVLAMAPKTSPCTPWP